MTTTPLAAGARPAAIRSMLARFLWTFFYIASFTLLSHLLWFWFVPAWLPLRWFLSGMPVVLLLMAPAFGPRPLARAWLLLLYPVLAIPAFICAEHIWMFHTPISTQSFYVIFETNINESRELFNTQFGLDTLFWALATLLPPLWLLRRAWRQTAPFSPRSGGVILLLLLLALSLRLMYGEERVFRTHLAYDFFFSWRDYAVNKKKLKDFVARSGAIRFPGVRNELPGDPPRTVIMVIGESANRYHHALYGYFRPTNPELSAIKDELLLFDNIVSSHSQTTPSIREAMSFPFEGGFRLPLVNLFRQAGFETVWLSNQVTYTDVGALFSTADRRIELNRGGDQSYIRNFDGVILPELEKILATPAPAGKRAIFIHLMGSHLNYASRYPKDFDIFTGTDDIPDAPWRSEKAKTYINKYDNSVRYTDHILAAIISLLRHTVKNAALVYFSDHGEEVYDSRPSRGHVNALDSPWYFDIPFIVWLSPSYRALLGDRAARWQTYLERPAINDMFPWAAADLAGIGMDDERRSRSVLSDDFQPAPRRMMGGDYDEAFPQRPRPGGKRADGTPIPARETAPGRKEPEKDAPS